MGYQDIKTDKEALKLIEEYLHEVTKRHPSEHTEQVSKSVPFAVGYLHPAVGYRD